MSKLIDTQLVLLSAAAQREDRMVVPPGNLNGPAATKILKPLLHNRFVEEVPAKNGYPIYRRDPDDGPIALRVMDKGLSVIGVEPQEPISPETAKEAASKKSPRKPGAQKQKPKARPKSGPAARERGSAAKVGGQGPKSGPPPKKAVAQPGAKQALLIEMLQAKRGANIDAIVKATGWLPHTGRAMISGLRKTGYRIELERAEGKKAAYRIVASPKKTAKARG